MTKPLPTRSSSPCACGHTAHWHSHYGSGQCEADAACECMGFTAPPKPYTSYELRWRADFAPRPDFVTKTRTVKFTDDDGKTLFFVTTAPGIPSDGILTLIREAPRLRDELDALTPMPHVDPPDIDGSGSPFGV